jgi:hypothetical protein
MMWVSFALAAAVIFQEPRLNPDDPYVETGMSSFRWIETSAVEAGFAYRRSVRLTFHRVSQKTNRPSSGIAPYWKVKFEQTTTGLEPSSTRVWLDGRTCAGVNDALNRLTVRRSFTPYDPDELNLSGPRLTPHGAQWSVTQYGTIDGEEVRIVESDQTGAALRPILDQAEHALEPCLASGEFIEAPAATS